MEHMVDEDASSMYLHKMVLCLSDWSWKKTFDGELGQGDEFRADEKYIFNAKTGTLNPTLSGTF